MNTPRTRKTLSPIESFRLMQYIELNYASLRLNDPDFAKKAAEDLQLPQVNENHVALRRNELGIPSHKEMLATAAKQGILLTEEELGKINRRLEHLEVAMAHVVSGFKGAE